MAEEGRRFSIGPKDPFTGYLGEILFTDIPEERAVEVVKHMQRAGREMVAVLQ